MRILLTETVDPEGALWRWMSPDLEASGHQVLIVPAQETVHYLGISGWQRLLCEISHNWQPDLILVHPPYDHLNRHSAGILRRDGALLIAFAFDDALFLNPWRQAGALAEVLHAYSECFDFYFTTCRESAEAAQTLGIRNIAYLRWALSPLATTKPASTVPDRVVLLGRAYPKRIRLARQLAEAGITLIIRGHGWSDNDIPGADIGGYIDAEKKNCLMHQGIVISPGDWEEQAIPMVKARVLEAAFAGACQIAANCRELADYFSPAEVPTYDSDAGLITELHHLCADEHKRITLAHAAYSRALSEHNWRIRFAELLDVLENGNCRPRNSAPRILDCTAYTMVLLNLASSAEFSGRFSAAQAYYQLAAANGAGISAKLGGHRCQFHLQDYHEAERGLQELIEPLSSSVEAGQLTLRASLSSPAAGAALGINRFIDPRTEALAYLMAAQVRCDKVDAALAVLDAINDPDRIVQIASLLAPDDQGKRFWQALFKAALAAKPLQLSVLQIEHAERWRAVVSKRDD